MADAGTTHAGTTKHDTADRDSSPAGRSHRSEPGRTPGRRLSV